MSETAPTPGVAVNGVATTAGSYNAATDFKNAPAGSYEAQLYAQSQGGSQAPVATATPPSLIVTSNASRSNYANNVNTINTATSNIPKSDPSNPSIVDFLSANNMPSDYASRSKIATDNGIQGYTGTAAQNTQILNILRNGKGSSGSSSTTTPPPNTTTDTTQTTDTSGPQQDNSTDEGTGLDPTYKKIYDDNIAALDSEAQNAQSNVDSALATVANDPALASVLGDIKSKYDLLYKNTQERNNFIFGGNNKSSFRNGMAQFASEMNTGFLNDQQGRADARLSDILSQESSAMVKATNAIKSEDVKAVNAAATELKRINTAKSKAILDLQKATNDAVKAQQAEKKAQQIQAKQVITDDIRLSTAVAKNVADTIKSAGLTDEKDIDAYIEGMAKKSGITNTDILKSAVVTAKQTIDKADLAEKNTEDTIANRQARLKIAQQKTVKAATGKKAAVDKGYTFNANTTKGLYGAGNTKETITQLQKDIATYGASKVIEEGQMDDATRTVLKDEFGL